MILSGKCVSPGVAEGRTHVIDVAGWLAWAIALETLRTPEAEVERVRHAAEQAGLELDRLRHLLVQRGRPQDAQIFAAQAMLLDDPKLIDRVHEEIRGNLLSAEAAVARIVVELYNSLKASALPVLRDKAADVMDVGQRLIRCLGESAAHDTAETDVIVANALAPSDLVRYAHQGIAAIITETCGAKSHTAILARGLGVPMVTGIESAVTRIRDGAMAIVDASTGTVIVDPTPAEEEVVRRIREARSAPSAAALAKAPRATRDGVPVQLLLNISDPVEAEQGAQAGLAGVGLYRTEFLYMDRLSWPSTEESYREYRRVGKAVGEGELNIRLADFGAEKSPSYADFPMTRNPSLGLRGVRLLLSRPEILEPQVQALARLGAERPLTVLIPMVDSLETLERILDQLERICGNDSGGALPFRVGAMIEVPAAALSIDEILLRVDAVAVGLNDLTQYMLAADRDDEFVESYHDALQPPVLRLLHRVIAAADARRKPVTMCGELAGDARLTALLLGLGVRRFSVSRSHANQVATALRELSVEGTEELAVDVLRCSTGAEVRALLRRRGLLPE